MKQFKKDARTLYNRGLISQRMCTTVLGLKEPRYRITRWLVRVTADLTSYLVRIT